MTRALLGWGRVVIAFDLAWLVFAAVVFIVLESSEHVAEATYFEYLFSFFHFVTMVTMLYLTERKNEHSETDYTLLNLDWKNAPLLFIPLLTDVAVLTRTIRSHHFMALLVVLHATALAITFAGLVWFVVAVASTKWCSKKKTVVPDYEPMMEMNAAERVGAKNWHSLKN